MKKILSIAAINLVLYGHASACMPQHDIPNEETRLVPRPSLYPHEILAKKRELARLNEIYNGFFCEVCMLGNFIVTKRATYSDVSNEKIFKRFDFAVHEGNESFKKIKDLCAELAPYAVSDTLLKFTRSPRNGSERAASMEMMRLFNERGIRINEVRFADAATYVQAMNLHPLAKAVFIFLLRTPDFPMEGVVEQFISDSRFSCSRLRERVKNDLEIGISTSATFRNLFIAAMAWSYARPSLCDLLQCSGTDIMDVEDRKFSFEESLKNTSYYNFITLKDDVCYHPSLVADLIGIPYYRFLDYKFPVVYPLFHEMGDTVFGKFGRRYIVNESETMRAVSKLTKLKANRDILLKIMDYYRNMSPAEQEEICDTQCFFREREIKNIDDFITAIEEVFASEEEMNKEIWTNSVEVLQINGFCVVTDSDGRNIMINSPVNDMALCTELGIPFRGFHSDFLWTCDFVDHMDDEMYRALLALQGFDMQDYLIRVHHNLTSYGDMAHLVAHFYAIERPLFRRFTFPIRIHPKIMKVLAKESGAVIATHNRK